MKKVEYKGKDYKNLKSMCDDLGLDYGLIWRRLKDGYTLTQAVNANYRHRRVLKAKKPKKEKIVYCGKEYNQTELCKMHNISLGTFRSRVKSGLSVEEALQKEFTCICDICGKKFISKRPNKKYCCKTCENRGIHGKGAYKTYNYKCTVCGKEYETIMNYNHECCSKRCRNQLARIDRNRRYKQLKEKGQFDNSVTLENVFNKFNGVCQCCNRNLTFECDCNDNNYPSIDHIKPLSKGGTHTWENVQLLCRGCNIEKSNL